MKKPFLALLLALAICLTACTAPPESTTAPPEAPASPTEEEPTPAPKPETSSLEEEIIKAYGAETVTQKDGIPRLRRKNYSLFDLRYSWGSPKEINTASYLTWFFSTVKDKGEPYLRENFLNPKLTEQGISAWFYPQDIFEEQVRTYFDVPVETLRRGEEYDPELEGYWSAQEGGCASDTPEITYTSQRSGSWLTIDINMDYEYGTILAEHFQLRVLLDEAGGWKYQSCTCEPNEVPVYAYRREETAALPLTIEQWALIDRALELARVFQIDTSHLPGDQVQNFDFTKTQEIDGTAYTLYQGSKYRGWEDFRADMLTVFTPEFFEELNHSGAASQGTFTEYEGKLYFLDMGRGTDNSYLPREDRYFAREGDGWIEVTWYAYYTDGDPFDENAKAVSVRAIPILLADTADGWRIDSLALPY